MAARNEIETLVSYVLSEKSRESLIKSGLDGVPKDRLVASLRGLQDLGWINGGSADFAESYSLTREGRRVALERPAPSRLGPGTLQHIEAIRAVDSSLNGERKEALIRLITIECELGNWDSALMYSYELKKIAERTRDNVALAASLFYEGKVDLAMNRWDEALESYLDALERYMEAGDRKGVCETNRAMGVVYGNKGDFASARRCFESSLAMAEETGDQAAAAKARGNLATIYDLEGRVDESENANKWCLNYFIETGDVKAAAITANNLGVLNMTRERFEVASEYFEKTISSGRVLGNKQIVSTALVNCAYCYARAGQTSQALAYTDEAVQMLKEPNDLNMLALAYRNYGYVEFRNSGRGFDWFEKSVRTAKSSGVEETFAACCSEYGSALIRSTTNLHLAKKLLKKASSTYESIGNMKAARAIDARLAAI